MLKRKSLHRKFLSSSALKHWFFSSSVQLNVITHVTEITQGSKTNMTSMTESRSSAVITANENLSYNQIM
jgi:hypothetical protein